MYEVAKLAVLSAALAAALMAAAGQRGDTSAPGKFLTDRLDGRAATRPAGMRESDQEGACAGAWPYRTCSTSEPGKPRIRVIASGAISPARP